jgi:hypothetical protein
VTEKSPSDVAIFELVDGDLAGESSIRLVKDVLGSDFEAGPEVFASK